MSLKRVMKKVNGDMAWQAPVPKKPGVFSSLEVCKISNAYILRLIGLWCRRRWVGCGQNGTIRRNYPLFFFWVHCTLFIVHWSWWRGNGESERWNLKYCSVVSHHSWVFDVVIHANFFYLLTTTGVHTCRCLDMVRGSPTATTWQL